MDGIILFSGCHCPSYSLVVHARSYAVIFTDCTALSFIPTARQILVNNCSVTDPDPNSFDPPPISSLSAEDVEFGKNSSFISLEVDCVGAISIPKGASVAVHSRCVMIADEGIAVAGNLNLPAVHSAHVRPEDTIIELVSIMKVEFAPGSRLVTGKVPCPSLLAFPSVFTDPSEIVYRN